MKKRNVVSCAMLGAILLILAVASPSAASTKEKNNGIIARTSTIPQHAAWVRYPIEGFAWPQSVKPGETIKIYVSMDTTLGNSYDMYIFRIPSQQMQDTLKRFLDLTGHFYPLHDANGVEIYPPDTSRKPVDYKRGCMGTWANGAVSFQIPQNDPRYKSGIYYALLKHRGLDDTVQTSWYYVAFVVRPAIAGNPSNILFKFSLNTIQAYNFWGGGSLYSATQEASLAQTDTIAIDRPVQFDFERAMGYTYTSFVEFLENQGYKIDYCNNIDVDSANINPVNNYKMLVFYGHDEYWSPIERSNIETGFKGSTVQGNIANFSPNTCYWQVNWIFGSGHSKLVCQKGSDVDLFKNTGSGP